MQDSRNKNNRDNELRGEDSSKRNDQQNTSSRVMGSDKSLQKDAEKNNRLRTEEPDNYERDSE